MDSMIARLQNHSRPQLKPFELKYCATFMTKLQGLMFRKNLEPHSGALLVETQDSVINTTIHMLFMNFDICTVWIDRSGTVVDVQLAKRWHLMYKPQKAACLVLETHFQHMNDFKLGDKIGYEII
jgi:uncharacterized membrane protein (UPF0127 family)